jgi:hypothetical protein
MTALSCRFPFNTIRLFLSAFLQRLLPGLEIVLSWRAWQLSALHSSRSPCTYLGRWSCFLFIFVWKGMFSPSPICHFCAKQLIAIFLSYLQSWFLPEQFMSSGHLLYVLRWLLCAQAGFTLTLGSAVCSVTLGHLHCSDASYLALMGSPVLNSHPHFILLLFGSVSDRRHHASSC